LSLMKSDPFLERRPLILEYRDDSESDHGLKPSFRQKRMLAAEARGTWLG
jgi:hypothetical protein